MERSEIFKKYSPGGENMLAILHELQNNNPRNYLSGEDLTEVAKFFNTTKSHVYGVATYYTMFSLKPRGKYIIRVCNSVVCHMEGTVGIVSLMEEILGVKRGETTADGLFTIELTECLGRCDVAPSMMVGEDVHGELDREKIVRIIKKYK
jgi:NADH:ubiquinone oxidoreductase subunit E